MCRRGATSLEVTPPLRLQTASWRSLLLPHFLKAEHNTALNRWSDVRINVHGRLDVAVSQTFLNHYRCDPALQEVGCVRVAQTFEGYPGENIVARKVSCPSCKAKTRTFCLLPRNFKCADLIRDFCGYLAQVKSVTVSDVKALPKQFLELLGNHKKNVWKPRFISQTSLSWCSQVRISQSTFFQKSCKGEKCWSPEIRSNRLLEERVGRGAQLVWTKLWELPCEFSLPRSTKHNHRKVPTFF